MLLNCIGYLQPVQGMCIPIMVATIVAFLYTGRSYRLASKIPIYKTGWPIFDPHKVVKTSCVARGYSLGHMGQCVCARRAAFRNTNLENNLVFAIKMPNGVMFITFSTFARL